MKCNVWLSLSYHFKGCTYVLHSSGQLYSHKRKHERRENELAYRKFRLAQNMLKSSFNNDTGINVYEVNYQIIKLFMVKLITFNFILFYWFIQGFSSLDEESNRSNSNIMSEADALANQIPLTQIGAIPLEAIIGVIPEQRCLRYFTKFVSNHFIAFFI